MKKLVLAGVAALALCMSVSSVVKASDYHAPQKQDYEYKKVVTYKTVIDYKVHTEKYVKYVTAYDDYGCPYKVAKVCYRDVKVPVKKVVPVVNYVKVKVCKKYCD